MNAMNKVNGKNLQWAVNNDGVQSILKHLVDVDKLGKRWQESLNVGSINY